MFSVILIAVICSFILIKTNSNHTCFNIILIIFQTLAESCNELLPFRIARVLMVSLCCPTPAGLGPSASPFSFSGP